MKYFYVGLAILLLSLALCITTTALLSRYVDETLKLLEQAQVQAGEGNFQQAEPLIRRAMEFWQSHRGFFGIILRHDEADGVNSTFRELLEYARNQCTEEFEPTCADLMERISHLSNMEKPLYYNVL